jgi:hypothetical protein
MPLAFPCSQARPRLCQAFLSIFGARRRHHLPRPQPPPPQLPAVRQRRWRHPAMGPSGTKVCFRASWAMRACTCRCCCCLGWQHSARARIWLCWATVGVRQASSSRARNVGSAGGLIQCNRCLQVPAAASGPHGAGQRDLGDPRRRGLRVLQHRLHSQALEGAVRLGWPKPRGAGESTA